MSGENSERGDGYIAVRKAELAAAIAEASPTEDASSLGDLLRLLGALLHHEAHQQLEALKTLYDPLDPDAPASRRDVSPAAFDRFGDAFSQTLARANFSEIDPDSVQTREATKLLTGLSIKPSNAGIRRIRYFARGAHPEAVEHRSWFGLVRKNVEADMMTDVVVLVGFKSEDETRRADRKVFAEMRRGVRPGAAIVKHFRNVATPELVTLHPGAKPSMRPRDQVFLAAPAVATGVPVLLNLWPALTVLFAVLAAFFGTQGVIEDSELKRAIAALSGLIAVGAFVMRQKLKYEAQSLRYQKRLADTVYFRNLANNAGVLDLLVGAGEEQDCKEAFLAYWALRRAGKALTKAEIDAAAEAFLRERFQLRVNFEINDALAKLERLQLVTREDEAYAATSPADALTRLDAAWDALFSFSARRYEGAAASQRPKDIPMNPNKALWEKGDFTRIAAAMRESGDALVASLSITPGLKVLDLGCGDGTTALPAAQRGANVLGVDIASNLVAAGNARAAALGLSNLRFEEGDASDLRQLEADRFDLVVSIFGAMFAPRPHDVAKEMVRVTRPGGRIIMGNWIPGDPTLVAQILKISSAYSPPPPEGFVSPVTWGLEANVIERFGGAGVAPGDIVCERDTYTFNFQGSPAAFVETFRDFYGPTMNAFDAARQSGRADELQRELQALFTAQNQSGRDDVATIPATFLRVTVNKR